MSFYTYILECADGSYYTGHTDDLEARLSAHHDGTFKGYTSRPGKRPLRLVFHQDFATRDEAFAAERQIKGMVAVQEAGPDSRRLARNRATFS
jgi:tRNA/rRNA methyltransferase